MWGLTRDMRVVTSQLSSCELPAGFIDFEAKPKGYRRAQAVARGRSLVAVARTDYCTALTRDCRVECVHSTDYTDHSVVLVVCRLRTAVQ